MIRAPIVVVGGHIDHGKTTLLDYLRGTAIAEREAGRITQHIGATEIPLELIRKQSGKLIEKFGFNLAIPGLLFIDTPGHEAFTTLRERGCSIADIGILVVDILQGVQPQTVEVINHLKTNKTPFVVGVTKIDKIKGYDQNLSLTDLLKEVDEGRTLYAQEFNEKFYKIMSKLSELGFDSERFDNVQDFTKKLLLVPLSSKTGIGIPELLLFLGGLSQKYLENSLALNVEGQGKAVVLEINETKGFGKTCDIILYDGKLEKNDWIKVDSKDNFYVTRIKQLLRPKALTDLRTVKSRLQVVDFVGAASGLKIVCSDPELISPGDELIVVTQEEADTLVDTKKAIVTMKEKGIIVKADTQGSLDAISALAKKSGVSIGKISTGNLVKEDVLEAKLFAREDFLYGCVFLFNQKISPEVEQFAKQQGIVVFSSNVVYKLFDDYEKWSKDQLARKKEEELKNAKYPAKFEVIKDCIFRKSKPCIFGIRVLDGLLKPNTKLIYNGKQRGTIKQIQLNNKTVSQAKKGDEVAVSSEDINFEKDIDLNVSTLFYTYIPSSQRGIIKKYLFSEYPDLIEKLFNLYDDNDL